MRGRELVEARWDDQENTVRPFDHQSGSFLSIESARLYYEETGDPDAAPLVLLHGGFGNIEDYNRLLSKLQRSFRVIGLDSRGHGKSELGTERLTYERLEQDLIVFLDTLKLEKVNILGFSDGGIVAYRFATHSSSRIDKLVTVGADFRIAEGDPTWNILSRMTPDLWRARFPNSVAAYERMNPKPDFDKFAKALIEMWLDLGPTGYPGERVSQIACELLIVRGDDDHLVPRRAGVDLGERVPRARLFNLPFAGHLTFDDQPESFVLTFERFFG